MNKFYLLSAFLHGIIIFSIIGFSKDEEIKFKEKNSVIVSVKNRKAISNITNVSLEKEEKEKKEKSIENKVEEKKKTLVEEKIIKKEVIKKDNTKKNLEKKKSKDSSLNKKDKVSEKKEKYNEFKDQNRFLQGEDGVFTAVSLDGIEYEIIKEIDPQYPLKARKIGYNGVGIVKVKFLVDLDGSIKNIEFISGETKFGFKEEVEKALKKWKFKPITYKGKIIRVHFEKEFKFKKG
ncbi:energy transducer TonB [Cetobacterium somerae]|uniref:energy transducer TonB n=1 Tax=Cetobacterium sp. NK01 TaxID=2993530 RepID=UPI002116900C|nr:energy transducer TonB [Cetobacterium sp. NK01]MCQ8211963.1 energy transducer TonB [Cetobacterium sp. NK01]